jgi:hypothetical protein
VLGSGGRPGFEIPFVRASRPRFALRSATGPVVEVAVARFASHGATVLTGRRPVAIPPPAATTTAPAAPPSATSFASLFAAFRVGPFATFILASFAVFSTRRSKGGFVACRCFIPFIPGPAHAWGAVVGVAIAPRRGRSRGRTRGWPGWFRRCVPGDAEIRGEGVPVATRGGGRPLLGLRSRPRGRPRGRCGGLRRRFRGGRRAERLGERCPGIVGIVFRHDFASRAGTHGDRRAAGPNVLEGYNNRPGFVRSRRFLRGGGSRRGGERTDQAAVVRDLE